MSYMEMNEQRQTQEQKKVPPMPETKRNPRLPEPKRAGASEYITISVAEYHCLTKAATMLELLMKARPYERDTITRVIEAALGEMMGVDGEAE